MSVLVAVGDDDQFEAVLNVAVEMATGFDEELYVTHITERESASGDERALRDEIREFLSGANVSADIQLEHLSRSGLRSGTAVGKQLVELTESADIDHIVIGHQSKNRLTTAREGHTGFVVATEATVPVTIVPEAVES